MIVFFSNCSTKEDKKSQNALSDTVKTKKNNVLTEYVAPDTADIPKDQLGDLIRYGIKLINNTPYYIGPDGIVSKNLKNKMTCSNCHLNAGTKHYGLNYFNTHKTYPQYRARENQVLSLADRINNCIERPHSGTPLDLGSKEMLAIMCYIKWLGEGYDGNKHTGHSIKYVEFEGLGASSVRGKEVYMMHCKSCHGENGEGIMLADKSGYTYPPLWGEQSYQEGSSMHRVIKAASFIRYNMPKDLTSIDKPKLSTQEALDVAAFINDGTIHKRPVSKYVCYPELRTKPIDYFKGPYLDGYPEKEHQFGPWDNIIKYYRDKNLEFHK